MENSEEKQPESSINTEIQIYRKIEAARAQIAGAVNATMKEQGLPTAIILGLLRGIVAETSLMLERAAGAAVRETIEKAAAADPKGHGNISKQSSRGDIKP